jgi:5-formyltetrahydrofolate cyclo-ligase
MSFYSVTMIEEKQRLRAEVRKKRSAIPLPNRVLKSATILERLFELNEMRSARWVKFYVSHGSEVETEGMIAHALVHGKRVAVPKVEGENRLMLSELLHPVRELSPGWKGIKEPKPDCLRLVGIEEMNLLVVPGIAYDEQGNRIGQGVGFYDRFLVQAVGRIPIVALAFELQIVPEVPVEPNDVRMDFIVTEKRIIKCKE